MSQFDNDLKIGDVITLSGLGFWKITEIERRFNTQPDLFDPTKAGQEVASMAHYELVLGSGLRPVGKNPRTGRCEAYSCKKVTSDWVDAEAKKAAEGWARLKAIL